MASLGGAAGCALEEEAELNRGYEYDELAEHFQRSQSALKSAATLSYQRLSDTGLYSDIGRKTLASGVIEFKPAYPLWTDGALKRRFIKVPSGSKINTSNMDFWDFPTGTKVWKEFKHPNGKLLETRLIEITSSGYEVATFIWNSSESNANRDSDGAQNIRGTQHDVPSDADCFSCHRNDSPVLGFSAIQLSHNDFPNIRSSVIENLLTQPPRRKFLVPGDPIESRAIGYLHGNCSHCHNDNFISFLKMRVFTSDNSVTGTDVYETAVDRNSFGQLAKRIAPGNPDQSELRRRMGLRNASQMPPLGTEFVDPDGLAAVEAWVNRLHDDFSSSPIPPSYTRVRANSLANMIRNITKTAGAAPKLLFGTFDNNVDEFRMVRDSGYFKLLWGSDDNSGHDRHEGGLIIESTLKLDAYTWDLSSGNSRDQIIDSVWTSNGWRKLSQVGLSAAVPFGNRFYYRTEFADAKVFNFANAFMSSNSSAARVRFFRDQ